MNFNLHRNEYDLQGLQTEEFIRLYGACCKLILTKKINIDKTFGDFSHIKTDGRNCFEIFAYPENLDEFDQYERLQTQFGIPYDTSIGMYVSKITAYNLAQMSINSQNEYDVTLADKRIQDLIGSIIIVPSGKAVEIVEVSLDAVGLNNTFLYNNSKNVYRFRCKTYVFRAGDEIDSDMVIRNPELLEKQNANNDAFDIIGDYFDELTKTKQKQDEETNQYFNDTDDVFGRF